MTDNNTITGTIIFWGPCSGEQPLHTLTKEQIQRVLRVLDMPDTVRKAFTDCHIDGAMLQSLESMADLEQIGLYRMHARRLMHCIDTWKQTGVPLSALDTSSAPVRPRIEFVTIGFQDYEPLLVPSYFTGEQAAAVLTECCLTRHRNINVNNRHINCTLLLPNMYALNMRNIHLVQILQCRNTTLNHDMNSVCRIDRSPPDCIVNTNNLGQMKIPPYQEQAHSVAQWERTCVEYQQLVQQLNDQYPGLFAAM